MARGWFTVRVELESGRGKSLHPCPGRIMLVGPDHTLEDLAVAIDLAFARWDLAHLHLFEFPDGRLYGMPDDENDLEISDYSEIGVGQLVRKGTRFTYVFDLGDHWKHRCQVIETNVDPLKTAGILPRNPVPIWGWGSIPDQYGRRWDGDDGADEE